jgi:hypothetical protein
MERITFDAYVVDVLMPDLVGHDCSCCGKRRSRDMTRFR